MGSFSPSWIRIRIRNLYADPDPTAQINADPCGSGSETLLVGYLVVLIQNHLDSTVGWYDLLDAVVISQGTYFSTVGYLSLNELRYRCSNVEKLLKYDRKQLILSHMYSPSEMCFECRRCSMKNLFLKTHS